jgi:predicted Fe-Mo cluster-binding NifX family protein
MKICVTAREASCDSPLDPRFGRARFFVVYDDETDTWTTLDNEQNLQAPQGAGIQSAARVVDAGCGVLISGHCGPKAFTALTRAGVSVYTASAQSARAAVDRFRRGELARMDGADVEGHW